MLLTWRHSLTTANVAYVTHFKLRALSTDCVLHVRNSCHTLPCFRHLQGDGVVGFILDLRDNAGGVVEAGVAVAKDFLRDGDILCHAMDRSGEEQAAVMENTNRLTDKPLVCEFEALHVYTAVVEMGLHVVLLCVVSVVTLPVLLAVLLHLVPWSGPNASFYCRSCSLMGLLQALPSY